MDIGTILLIVAIGAAIQAGILAGENFSGVISGVSVSGTIQALTTSGSGTIVGGIVGDNDDGTDVIKNRQGSKEDFQANGNPTAQQG